jgi:hypothetical protein
MDGFSIRSFQNAKQDFATNSGNRHGFPAPFRASDELACPDKRLGQGRFLSGSLLNPGGVYCKCPERNDPKLLLKTPNPLL